MYTIILKMATTEHSLVELFVQILQYFLQNWVYLFSFRMRPNS